MEALNEFFEKYLQISRMPSIRVTDVLEVLILAFLLSKSNSFDLGFLA